jgi:hypothetical protein
VCGIPFFPRVLVHLIGLGLVVRQRRPVGLGQRPGLDRMSQAEQMLAADADLAGELGGGLPLGDTAEDQKDLRRAQVSPMSGGVSEHVEDPAAILAAMIDDRGIGTTTVDVEAIAGATTRASESLGMEQIEEPLAATLLVHQVDDREVHGVVSGEMKTNKPQAQETKSAGG